MPATVNRPVPPRRTRRGVHLAATLAALGACLGAEPEPPPLAPLRSAAGTENLWRLHARVISGGVPVGDAAFAELHALGVRRVISVDAARPDTAAAERHGLRYIHMPIGYDGVDGRRIEQLAGALLSGPGVCYVHCHHGLHRAPAAAAAGAIAAGLVPRQRGLQLLQSAGTSPAYRGLHRAVAGARPLERGRLAAAAIDLPSSVAPPPLAEAMAAADRSYQWLRRSAALGWRAPRGRPQFSPAAEAVLLREHFAEMLRTPGADDPGGDFRGSLRQAERLAGELSSALAPAASPAGGAAPPFDASRARDTLRRVGANCRACHARHRDG